MPRGLESETLHAWGGGRRLAASAAGLFRCSEFAWEVRYLVWCMGAVWVCGVISRSRTCSDMPQSQSHSSSTDSSCSGRGSGGSRVSGGTRSSGSCRHRSSSDGPGEASERENGCFLESQKGGVKKQVTF